MRARAFRYNSFNKAETEGKTEGEIEGGEIEGERWKVGDRGRGDRGRDREEEIEGERWRGG